MKVAPYSLLRIVPVNEAKPKAKIEQRQVTEED